jgi:hypothetical protein
MVRSCSTTLGKWALDEFGAKWPHSVGVHSIYHTREHGSLPSSLWCSETKEWVLGNRVIKPSKKWVK